MMHASGSPFRPAPSATLLKDVLKDDLVRATRAARGTPRLDPRAHHALMRQVAKPPKESPFDVLTPRES
jgi:DNA-binding NarL/FixJ family response regulator